MAEVAWTPRFARDAPQREGIYRCLSATRLKEIEPFLAHYRRIREADGYRQRKATYYRSLPYVGAQDPQSATWRIRQQSLRNLTRMLQRLGSRQLRVLDLGAGSGWLSHRLTELGHTCVALDWLDDVEDGLGAVAYYPVRFTCVQADFDDLPLAPRQFDVVIFNASLHYARDPGRTLQNARAMLVPGGLLVVMDSPVFRTDESGRKMLAAPKFDVRSRDGTPLRWGVGYLTEGRLRQAARDANLTVRWMGSNGGPGWALKRRIAGLKARRAPARFGLWFGVSKPASS